MKRDENLQPLSRQHHNALMAVLLLKKGVQKKADVQVMQDFILAVWKDDLQQHFQLEENWLPVAPHEPKLTLLYERMLQEHERIRKYIHQFSTTLTSHETVKTFYELLEQHVRFEEREYFPAIEQFLTSEELDLIGQHFVEPNGKFCADLQVKFWE